MPATTIIHTMLLIAAPMKIAATMGPPGSSIFAEVDRGEIPRAPRLVTPRSVLEADGQPVPSSSSWLERAVNSLEPPQTRYEDWQHLAWSIGLSDLQWQTSLTRYTEFRGDSAQATVWFDSLNLRLDLKDPELVEERMELARLAREYRNRHEIPRMRFFAWLRDQVLHDSQLATAGHAERALIRRIRLGSIVVGYEGLETDPDWLLLRAMRRGGAMSAESIVAAHAVLEPWRAEADSIVDKMVPASDDYIRAADGSWAKLLGPSRRWNDETDFQPHRAAAKRLFDLQRRWMAHTSAFFEIADVVVPDALLDGIGQVVESRQCALMRYLDTSPFDSIAAFMSELDSSSPAEIDALVELLATRTEVIDQVARECCAADRDMRTATEQRFPLTSSKRAAAAQPVSRHGNAWFDEASSLIRTLTEATTPPNDLGLDPESLRDLRDEISDLKRTIDERRARWILKVEPDLEVPAPRP